MKIQVQPIAIPETQTDERIVKRTALVTFRLLRTVAEHAKKAPGIMAQASTDIREAWAESARPNV